MNRIVPGRIDDGFDVFQLAPGIDEWEAQYVVNALMHFLGVDLNFLKHVAYGYMPARIVVEHPRTREWIPVAHMNHYNTLEHPCGFHRKMKHLTLNEIENYDCDCYGRQKEKGYYVYRLLGAAGRVLYVGSTRNLSSRLAAHHRRWGSVIADVAIERYDDAETMLEAEAAAIHDEQPPLNHSRLET